MSKTPERSKELLHRAKKLHHETEALVDAITAMEDRLAANEWVTQRELDATAQALKLEAQAASGRERETKRLTADALASALRGF